MKKLITLSFIMILLFGSMQAQTYYGKKSFGRLKMVDDSICTVTFISCMDINNQCVDTCYIHKQGDTIFLSTKAKWRYKVNVFEEEQIATEPLWKTPIKIYKYYSFDKSYSLMDVSGIYYEDSNTGSIIIEQFMFTKGFYIIIYRDIFEYYRVKYFFNEDKNYVVLERNHNYANGVIFNEFSLLVKGNRLLPIDKEKQMQCWFDNGFFFPKMRMSKKYKKYNVINGYHIGLRNLPAEIKKGISKPLPRRYVKDLEDYIKKEKKNNE